MPAITNVNELQDISLDLAGDYWLANNIDASGFGFVPLGTFTGILDGKDYAINDLTITVNGAGTQYGALITINQGTVKNLRLENCAISVTATNPLARAYAAGMVFQNDATGIFTNCHVAGIIAGIATGTTSGSTSDVGGFVVWNYGTISRCYSTATITLDGKNVEGGGFAAWSNGPISECYASGNVAITGTNLVLAAGFITYISNPATITDCYARGNASATGGATNKAAGFIQQNISGIITNCFSTGVPTGASGIGGFCQTNGDTIIDCFWDTQTSGTAVSDGGTGKTTTQMKRRSTFTGAGWDFIIIWAINGITNNGYPFFWTMPPEPLPDAPRRIVAVQDKISLECVRNVEMAAGGRCYTNEEGKFVYKSRYARNA